MSTVHTCTVCATYAHSVQARVEEAGRKHTRALAAIRAAETAGLPPEPVQTHLAGATWRAAEAAR